MIHIYQNAHGFRVVAGPHQVAAEHKRLAPRVYASADDAFKIEADPAIRDALTRLGAEPTAPSALHHIERTYTACGKPVLKHRKFSGARKPKKVCADCGQEGVLTGHMECMYPGSRVPS